MNVRRDGHPAFPESGTPGGPFGGMSMREWYAGQSLVGVLANLGPDIPQNAVEMDTIARGCFLMADAMIKAGE